MDTSGRLMEKINSGRFDKVFARLYQALEPGKVRRRYCGALRAFEDQFGEGRPVMLLSAPGRTEIGGNHTDHQRGRVLAAAIDLDILCVASPNTERIARIRSEGFPMDAVELSGLEVCPEETNTAAALIRGVAVWFHRHGHEIGGFDAYTTSEVLQGSGLSSSAAFEVAVGLMINHLYNRGGVSAADIAKAGQYAENLYFGKPCGLMDQMASSVGGLVEIDFRIPEHPVLARIPDRLREHGYRLCIMDTGGSHADLTEEYAAIPREMGAVSAFFGKDVLSDVSKEDFYGNVAALRRAAGDRGVLRAFHFFEENKRVEKQAAALRNGHIPEFLALVRESGESSFTCLQNIFPCSHPREQGLSLALAFSKKLLGTNGAWRVHGGGFAGTVQAFVHRDDLDRYTAGMEAVFGAGACHVLSIRPVGGVRVMEAMEFEEDGGRNRYWRN